MLGMLTGCSTTHFGIIADWLHTSTSAFTEQVTYLHKYSELLGFWTVSIVRYSQNISETGSVSVLR
jgi:hypothetical protein